jgi:hypothetical protein
MRRQLGWQDTTMPTCCWLLCLLRCHLCGVLRCFCCALYVIPADALLRGEALQKRQPQQCNMLSLCTIKHHQQL